MESKAERRDRNLKAKALREKTTVKTLQEIALTAALQAPLAYESLEIPWGIRAEIRRRFKEKHRLLMRPVFCELQRLAYFKCVTRPWSKWVRWLEVREGKRWKPIYERYPLYDW